MIYVLLLAQNYEDQLNRAFLENDEIGFYERLKADLRHLMGPDALTITPEILTNTIKQTMHPNGTITTDDSEDWVGTLTPLESELAFSPYIPTDNEHYEPVARIILPILIERIQARLKSFLLVERAESRRPDSSPPMATRYVSFTEVVESWALRAKPSPKSKHQYGAHLRKLSAHLGHDDAALVTEANIEEWIDALLVVESQANVMTRVNCIKTLFKVAAKRKLISSSPAADVEFKAKKNPRNRKVGYNDNQARTILMAARAETDAVKRWTPWIGAFTGARLGEMCGAMAADVAPVDGVMAFNIDPMNRDIDETLKNDESVRSQPIHPALIAEGFLDYVATLDKKGPLFPKLPPDKWGKRAGTGSKRISRWIGSLGIQSANLQPSHAWRHRFTNECMKAGMPIEHRCALEGHSMGTVSEKHYQAKIAIATLYESICKLPNPVLGD